jgi:hypothetical protein
VTFDVENGNLMVPSNYGLHKRQQVEALLYLLQGVYEILPIISTILFRLGYYLLLTFYIDTPSGVILSFMRIG